MCTLEFRIIHFEKWCNIIWRKFRLLHCTFMHQGKGTFFFWKYKRFWCDLLISVIIKESVTSITTFLQQMSECTIVCFLQTCWQFGYHGSPTLTLGCENPHVCRKHADSTQRRSNGQNNIVFVKICLHLGFKLWKLIHLSPHTSKICRPAWWNSVCRVGYFMDIFPFFTSTMHFK